MKRRPFLDATALGLDGTTEQFTGATAAAANALLTRAYRAPFTVPQIA